VLRTAQAELVGGLSALAGAQVGATLTLQPLAVAVVAYPR